METTKINKVYVVGTVQEVDTNIRKTADGREYINGKVIVKTIVNEQEYLFDFKLISFALNKNGEPNKMYQSYTKLDGFLQKRVRISGEFREGSIVDQSTGKVRHFNELALKFVNAAKVDDVDCATFEFSGFVVKALYERKNKDDELLGYRIEIGQANYNNTNINVIRFDVDKNDINIANVIEANYLPGSTVKFNGILTHTSRVESKVEEVMFGDPIVKTYTVVDKLNRITGGDEPFAEDAPDVYTPDLIKTLVAAYRDADNKRMADAASAVEAPANTTAAAMSKITRPSSLI